MEITVQCNECETILIGTVNTYGTGEIVIRVAPCGCQEKRKANGPIVMDYDDILEVFQGKVEIRYHKKNGEIIDRIGFLGLQHELRPDIVYFVERADDTDEPEVKCFVRDRIQHIVDLETEVLITIKEGS
jgi:hypothetical protein